MSLATHCDGPTCDTWAKPGMDRDFLTVTTTGHDGANHFCGWDCLLRFAARIAPPTMADELPGTKEAA